MRSEHPRRILVIRTDKVGDMLLSTAAIRAVGRGCPDACLVVLASPYNAPVLGGWPIVHAVELFDHRWPIARRAAVARALRRRCFDLCVVLHPHPEAFLVARWTGAARRVGVVHERRLIDRTIAPALLSECVVSRVESAAARGGRVPHEVELTRQAVERAGIPWAGDDLEVRVPSTVRAAADLLLARTWPERFPTLGFHLSGKWLNEGWTIEQLGTLLLSIIDDHPDCRLLVTHGPCDAGVAADLLALPRFGFDARVDHDSGLTLASGAAGRVLLAAVDFEWWAALLARCAVVVSRDTGSLHLASALGRAVAVVYEPDGYDRNSRQFAPWRVRNRALRGGPFEQTAPAIRRSLHDLLGQERSAAVSREYPV